MKKQPCDTARRLFFVSSSLVNRNLLPILAQTLEADHAVRLGEQGVVAAAAHIHAGVDMGAALADQDVASQNVLSVGALGPETLALGITAVLGGTNALLMGEELQSNVHHVRYAILSVRCGQRGRAYSPSSTSI